MKANIEEWIQEALSGRHPSAAAKAASHRDSHGSDISACAELAARAAKLGQPKILALAFAACPEALGAQCSKLLGRLSPACALFCLRHSDALLSSASALAEQERREAQRLARLEQAALASVAQASPKAFLTRAELGVKERQAGGAKKAGPKDPAAPAIVVNKRRLKIDRDALAIDIASRQGANPRT